MSARLALRTLRRPQSQPSLKLNGSGSLFQASIHSNVARQGHCFGLNYPQRLFREWRGNQRISRTHLRTFALASIPSILVPPVVFAGLLVVLWTWKCVMMVVFQDKIIYMPSMPPFARSEKLDDYTAMCKPVKWEERHIKSLDGTKLALCIGSVDDRTSTANTAEKDVMICYFQGNGSSLPPRVPILSNVLKSVNARTAMENISIRYTLLVLSYRGYWTSSGRASQSGIELDAQALLNYIPKTFINPYRETELILWGQSIGSGVATTAAAKYISAQKNNPGPKIAALVLETPFTSVKSMLIALYPQKWLPYRYLWPFLWNRWDSEAALRGIASSGNKPKVLILPATRDEVVPSEEADKLEQLCKELKFSFERKNIEGALHSEATVRRDGQEAIAKFVTDVVWSK